MRRLQRRGMSLGRTVDGVSGGGAGDPGIPERLLDAAERLFAQHGVAGTSVRDITGEAGVNVAAVNYYFGSREHLVSAVIDRRLTPLNEERLRLLDDTWSACWNRGAESRPTVEDVLAALVGPSIRLCFEHPYFARLASQLRADGDPALWQDYRSRQAGVMSRFRETFASALPELAAEEVATRLHYILGAIQHIWAHCPLPAEETPERLLASFLTFYSAGLHAPAPAAAAG
jgi:AcrR family transcriptional regulator